MRNKIACFLLPFILLLSACTGTDTTDKDIRDKVNDARQATSFLDDAYASIDNVIYLFNYYDNDSYQVSKSRTAFSTSLQKQYFPSATYSGSEILDTSKEIEIRKSYITDISPEKVTFLVEMSISQPEVLEKQYKIISVDYYRKSKQLANVEEIV